MRPVWGRSALLSKTLERIWCLTATIEIPRYNYHCWSRPNHLSCSRDESKQMSIHQAIFKSPKCCWGSPRTAQSLAYFNSSASIEFFITALFSKNEWFFSLFFGWWLKIGQLDSVFFVKKVPGDSQLIKFPSVRAEGSSCPSHLVPSLFPSGPLKWMSGGL